MWLLSTAPERFQEQNKKQDAPTDAGILLWFKHSQEKSNARRNSQDSIERTGSDNRTAHTNCMHTNQKHQKKNWWSLEHYQNSIFPFPPPISSPYPSRNIVVSIKCLLLTWQHISIAVPSDVDGVPCHWLGACIRTSNLKQFLQRITHKFKTTGLPG